MRNRTKASTFSRSLRFFRTASINEGSAVGPSLRRHTERQKGFKFLRDFVAADSCPWIVIRCQWNRNIDGRARTVPANQREPPTEN
jgi:hypothetical protein